MLFVTGSRDGQKMHFYGEGDQEPNLEAGDVIIVLDEKPHKVFKRRHNDLVINLEISLTEALCGFKRPLKTLDDRTILLTSFPGESLTMYEHIVPEAHYRGRGGGVGVGFETKCRGRPVRLLLP